MPVAIRPLHPVVVGEVAGIDCRRPLSPEEVTAIDAGSDLVMWDNRSTMHRARRFDRKEVRDVRRTTLAGDTGTIEDVA